MADSREFIDIKCDWKKFDTAQGNGYPTGYWSGKAFLYNDGHFHGYACKGPFGRYAPKDIMDIIVGYYDKDLGITAIMISENPKLAPKLYRAVINDDGTYEGDFYAVPSRQVIIQNMDTKQMLNFNQAKFVRLGRAKFTVGPGALTLGDEMLCDYLERVAKNEIKDALCQKIINNYATEKGIKELREDLADNVYLYEKGAYYCS